MVIKHFYIVLAIRLNNSVPFLCNFFQKVIVYFISFIDNKVYTVSVLIEFSFLILVLRFTYFFWEWISLIHVDYNAPILDYNSI